MRNNTKPEEMVRNEVKFWASMNGFWLHSIESKATFSVKLGRYGRKGPAPKGFSDLTGIGPKKEPVYIELKAPGKLSNLSVLQKIFLTEGIQRGGFCVVVDSAKRLQDYYNNWKLMSEEAGKKYLLSLINTQKELL